MNQRVVLVSGDLERGSSLAEERHNGLSGVTTDDGDGDRGSDLLAREDLSESLGTDNIQSGDTEKAPGVENASVFEHLGSNGDSGVNGVRNDKHERLRSELGDALNEIPHDTSVDLEEVVTGHAGLTYWTVNNKATQTGTR